VIPRLNRPLVDRYRVEVDAERDLVLSVHAFFADEAYQTVDAIELQLDGPVDEGLFEFREPPDATVLASGAGLERLMANAVRRRANGSSSPLSGDDRVSHAPDRALHHSQV
jgi:hypothetical protein